MKNRKVYVTTFCGVAVAMNIVLGIITSALGIPLYLDTLGNVLSAAILGPVPGIIVGALSNIITGLSAYLQHCFWVAYMADLPELSEWELQISWTLFISQAHRKPLY